MCEDSHDPFNFSVFFLCPLNYKWFFFSFPDDHDVLSFLLFRLTEPGQQVVSLWLVLLLNTSKNVHTVLVPQAEESEWVEGCWATGEWVTTDHAALCSCLMSSASFCHPSLAEACTWARDSQRGAGQIPGRVHEFPTRAGQEEGGVPEGAPRRAGPTQWVRAQLSLLFRSMSLAPSSFSSLFLTFSRSVPPYPFFLVTRASVSQTHFPCIPSFPPSCALCFISRWSRWALPSSSCV